MSKALIALGVVALVVVSFIVGMVIKGNSGYSEEQLQSKINESVNPMIQQLSNKDAQIENLSALATSLQAQIASFGNSTNVNGGNGTNTNSNGGTNNLLGYLIDELKLNGAVKDKVLSDREVPKLLDTQIEFLDKSYDLEETFSINDGMTLNINKDKYKEDAYMNVLKGAISYNVLLENSINLSKVSNDDPLEFSFLGNDVKVTKWNEDANEITIGEGKEYTMNQGDSITVDNKSIVITTVSDNDNIFITVDGVSKEIKEGSTKTINGIQIRADTVIFSDNSVNPKYMAILVIGTDVEKTISDGDEYSDADNNIWEYSIGDHRIGLVLKEDFNSIDSDETFKALAGGEKICLPNDYICAKYNGLLDEKYENYRFYMDGSTLIAKGKFEAGLKDYDKIYIASNGSVYEKSDLTNVISAPVYIGNSDVTLSSVAGILSFENLTIARNDTSLTAFTVDGASVSGKEDNYRSIYGTIVLSPKDNYNDNVVSVKVPMDQVQSSISVI